MVTLKFARPLAQLASTGGVTLVPLRPGGGFVNADRKKRLSGRAGGLWGWVLVAHNGVSEVSE